MLRKVFLLGLIGLGTYSLYEYVNMHYSQARSLAFPLNGMQVSWGMVGAVGVMLLAVSMLSGHKGRR